MKVDSSKIKFLEVKDLVEVFGSRSSIDKMRAERLLPIPVCPYGRRIMWPEHEINKIKLFIAAGLNKKELYEKVLEIESARKELLSDI